MKLFLVVFLGFLLTGIETIEVTENVNETGELIGKIWQDFQCINKIIRRVCELKNCWFQGPMTM